MSLWGMTKIAPNAYLILNNFILTIEECLVKMFNVKDLEVLIFLNTLFPLKTLDKVKLQAKDRIGPHNKEVLTVLFGSLLGDCHAEHRDKGTRFCFYQESSHATYLLWLHDYLFKLGYCNNKTPQIQTRLGKKGKVIKVIRFKTWTYANLNWVHDLWYINNTKTVPSTIGEYLTPLGLSIWIMDDGSKVSKGLKLCTNSFTYSDNLFLVKVLYDNFNIKSSVISAGFENQYNIYIWKESMSLLRDIVLPYVHPSMKYKLNY